MVDRRARDKVVVRDAESQPPPVWVESMVGRLVNDVGRVARLVEGMTQLVDEYRPAGYIADSTSVAQVTPAYESPEVITSILVLGPPGNVTLQLGDRHWPLTIPASGLLVIAPVQLLLSRTDDRVLTGGAAGAYYLELMGHAHVRGANVRAV